VTGVTASARWIAQGQAVVPRSPGGVRSVAAEGAPSRGCRRRATRRRRRHHHSQVTHACNYVESYRDEDLDISLYSMIRCCVRIWIDRLSDLVTRWAGTSEATLAAERLSARGERGSDTERATWAAVTANTGTWRTVTVTERSRDAETQQSRRTRRSRKRASDTVTSAGSQRPQQSRRSRRDRDRHASDMSAPDHGGHGGHGGGARACNVPCNVPILIFSKPGIQPKSGNWRAGPLPAIMLSDQLDSEISESRSSTCPPCPPRRPRMQ
jgi:hypothetical protein